MDRADFLHRDASGKSLANRYGKAGAKSTVDDGRSFHKGGEIPYQGVDIASLQCLPDHLRDDFGSTWGELAIHMNPLPSRTKIFFEDDRFGAIYAIRSGSIKKSRLLKNGKEQIVGFYFAKDIVGISGVASQRYTTTAETLDTTALCIVPFKLLEEKARNHVATKRKLFELFADCAEADQKLIRILRTKSADSRVAAFIVYMVNHFSKRGLSDNHFRLPMSRKEIANYLGLTMETTSRSLSRLANDGMLQVDNREIRIIDRLGINNLAGVCFI